MGGDGDGNNDGDNNLYDPSSADKNDGKQEEEDMQDKEPDEGEPPDNNYKAVPEKSSEPVDVRNESTISLKTTSDTSELPVDVFGDYLLMEKLIRERETKTWLHLAVGKLKHTIRTINVILLKWSLNYSKSELM